MTDDLLPGLGRIPSPPDERDWPVDALYALAGVEAPLALPASYRAPAPYPPVLNQGSTPRCVAYSGAADQMWKDLRDTGAFTPDEPLFFARIGGTANGAVIRDAMAQRLEVGYPPSGNATAAAQHRVAAYAAVPVTQQALCSAILALGPIVVGTPWFNSWFRPVNGVLPAPDRVVGGHAIVADGWTPQGLELLNSWGPAWGAGGRAVLPWAYLGRVDEAWKAVDQVLAPSPRPRVYTLQVAAGARVTSYALAPQGCLTGTQVKVWGPRPSSAGCSAAVVKTGCSSGQATVVCVPRGAFAGRWVRLGEGVTVTWT